MTLLEDRLHGRLADLIFFPPTIHPDLRAMLNPESLRKRKRTEESTTQSPKRARLTLDPVNDHDGGFGDAGFNDGGFNDGGFNDGGFNDGRFGDGGFGDGEGFNSFHQPSPTPHRTPSPSLVDETSFQEDEPPTALTGSMSNTTLATAHLLQAELSTPTAHASLHTLTKRGVPGGGGVRRDDAVRMFFEVLVLASRDVVRVRQDKGFGEIEVWGKEGLWGGKFGQGVVV
jgi:cohesin complex subunit SCC1